MAPIPELDKPIDDGFVALRDAAERDIPEILIAHQDDPELHIRIGLERPPSAADLGREVEEEAGERASGAGARLTVLEHGSDEFRGRISVGELDWDHARAELGVWIVPHARGRGLARASLRLASRWLFDSCGLQRVGLLIDPGNEPMIRAARAAGFAHEGVLRAYTVKRARRVDAVVLSLLAGDGAA
jgi:RimJ/RimL family protein N-acetyltransferase